MKTVTGTTRIPCTPETFWKLFFDETYLKALYLDGLGFKSFSVLEVTDTTRKTSCSPKINMPGMEKLIGDSFAYEEHGTLDKSRGVWTWRMVHPPGKKPMVSSHGTLRLAAEGEGSVRSDEVVIEAHMFGIGGMIEATAEKEVRAGWQKELGFLETWLKKR